MRSGRHRPQGKTANIIESRGQKRGKKGGRTLLTRSLSREKAIVGYSPLKKRLTANAESLLTREKRKEGKELTERKKHAVIHTMVGWGGGGGVTLYGGKGKGN